MQRNLSCLMLTLIVHIEPENEQVKDEILTFIHAAGDAAGNTQTQSKL